MATGKMASLAFDRSVARAICRQSLYGTEMRATSCMPSNAMASLRRQSRQTRPAQQHFHTYAPRLMPPAAPKSKDRGPPSKEDTQTDFGMMDIYSNTQAPTTAINTCMADGFALDSGLKITGAGVLLYGGEAFQWRPWHRTGGDARGERTAAGTLRNAKGQFDVDKVAWGVLDLAWPKPDLLILGTGKSILPLSPQTRQHINDLGIRIEVQDTRNAAAQFNLLATERGVQQVAAALVPIGWTEKR